MVNAAAMVKVKVKVKVGTVSDPRETPQPDEPSEARIVFHPVESDELPLRSARVRSEQPKPFPSARSALIFGVATAVLAVASVAGVFLLAVFNRPYASVALLAASMVAAGVLRAVWPGSPWFSARSKWWDVAVFLAIGAALFYLLPWAGAVPPG